MSATRMQKMARMLKEELSRIIREEINDPRLGFVSITDIEVTPDLRMAHVYFSVYGTPEEQETSMNVLHGAASFLRGTLGRQVEMRYTPELRFHLDRSIERGAHVSQIMNKLEIPPATEDDHEE